ncbi:aconitate hydratase AcnA [Pseudohalioglobus sediminis]|uniref:Aconitate hydratase n=1 Tax=Pseudohalioglobus sediminis TaxID=2606449 RepID=A0A5B0X3Z3_9GAMM|nr:aconitate hydratase AcnA [Pseudohalioglobus sediminis]KAA1194016.1 aconitate hydratase AcnA [Pseudohalioglobus sediminis]
MSTRYSREQALSTNAGDYTIYPFDHLDAGGDTGASGASTLPYSLKILLENLLRHGGEDFVTDDDVQALVNWDPQATPSQEIAFVPARVLLQDFTGVPAIVDLAAMRDAMIELGGKPDRINPLSPVELVIDHSVMVDYFGTDDALQRNTEVEIQRNLERYRFLRWGQQAFDNFKVVPPGTGIVHQVNLEYLARGVFTREQDERSLAYPDTLVGTDSHTTMINGLGVLGWGVGGIEAEAAMLGQPVTMLIPQVVGFRLTGELAEGATATDLVLTVTEALRAHGVVGKFVEFFGPGLAHLSLADRATIANMAPEYGATCGIFPVDQETINYLRLTGRDESQLQLVEQYMRAMGMWHDENSAPARYTAELALDLGDVVPSLAGPKRPQDRIPLTGARTAFQQVLQEYHDLRAVSPEEQDWAEEGGPAVETREAAQGVPVSRDGEQFNLEHGAVVIAAITSCTNTSNPAVLIAAGLLARKARQLGLRTRPWVKTSLAPGSKVVTEYLQQTGLLEDLEAMGFYLVGYGCTTCIGNSGPLPDDITDAIHAGDLLVTSVLSGNRNFEGRIHQDVRANYLASPPLVVAYALAGNMGVDLYKDGLGEDAEGNTVYLADIWPSSAEINELIASHINPDMFKSRYADVFTGNEVWNQLPVADSELFDWPDSTYVRKPTFFDGMPAAAQPTQGIEQARCLVKVGDSVTTDHISPAGAIAIDSPAGEYLIANGVEAGDFNSYGSRRGNHEVMMRGTFANVRLRNELAPGTEGSWTTCFETDEVMSIFAAAERYREQDVPLVVLAGKEYGTGSSRDWAAKGPALLGVRAVIAESYERIHRSNLIGMGILPLQYAAGDSAASLELDGTEAFSIPAVAPGQDTVTVTVQRGNGSSSQFEAVIRIDTPNEFAYFANGGILHYVLRDLAAK